MLVVFYGGHKNLPFIVVVHESVELNSTDDDNVASSRIREKMQYSTNICRKLFNPNLGYGDLFYSPVGFPLLTQKRYKL